MCGIAAILLHPQQRSGADWQAIREAFCANLEHNEARGREATGVAIVQDQGRVSLIKRPLAASDFVRSTEWLNLLHQVGPDTTLLLGHTRLPTKGDPALFWNNHPIQAGPILGVHNGEVANDDELFAWFGLPRAGQVDSEIIFRLIESAEWSESDPAYLAALRLRLSLLAGNFAILAGDLRRPARLLALRRHHPLCVLHQPLWNALVFSSSYVFLRMFFGRRFAAQPLDPERLMLFDARSIDRAGVQPDAAVAMPAPVLSSPERSPATP